LIRQKAFTLVTLMYDKIRDGLIYARRDEGDADSIAPSLYLVRGTSSRRTQDGGEEQPPVDAAPTGTTAHPVTPPESPTASLSAALNSGTFSRQSAEG
jgi:hypothetical protein